MKEKAGAATQADLELEVLCLQLRLASDLRVLPIKGHGYAAGLMQSIGKKVGGRIGGYMRYCDDFVAHDDRVVLKEALLFACDLRRLHQQPARQSEQQQRAASGPTFSLVGQACVPGVTPRIALLADRAGRANAAVRILTPPLCLPAGSRRQVAEPTDRVCMGLVGLRSNAPYGRRPIYRAVLRQRRLRARWPLRMSNGG